MFDEPRRLHPATILIGSGVFVKQALFPLAMALFAGARSAKNHLFLYVLGAAALFGLLALIGPLVSFLRTRYVIRDDSLILNTGWLWLRTRVIPLHRIHNVNFRQNLIHRLLRATAVQIETAAGAGVEAELPAVGVLDAYELRATLLRQPASEEREESEATPEAAPEVETLYVLSPRQLVIAGALTNRLLYILAGVTAVFQFDELFKDVARPLVAWLGRLDPTTGAIYSAAIFFLLILVGWVLSILYSLTRFYGFRIERHPGGLLLKYGLLTRVQTVVATGRVQMLRYIQPPLFRLFGFCEVNADTAGSFDAKELGGSNKICPIAAVDELDAMTAIALPGIRFSQFEWKRLSPRSVPRRIVSSVIGSTVFFGGIALALRLAPAAQLGSRVVPLEALAAAWALAIAWGVVKIKLTYRVEGYGEQPGSLAARVGFWRRHVAMAPIDRAQWVEVQQGLFQHRWRLADVALGTAAGVASKLTIPDLDVDEAHALKERLVAELRAATITRRTAGL